MVDKSILLASALQIIQPSTSALAVVWGEPRQRIANSACRQLLVERLGAAAWEAGLETILDQVFADCPDLSLAHGREHRLRIASGASVFQIEVHASPIRSEGEEPVGALLMLIERSSDAGEAREKSVRRHLEFRFRNVFATLRSILSRSAGTTPSIEDLEMHLSGRIDALSRIHGALLRRPEGADLENLLSDELTAAGGLILNVTIDGPDCTLAPSVVEPLGLALHELATNSIKFGALSDPRASLSVSWKLEPAGCGIILDWIETGVSVVSAAPRRRGFGFTFLEHALPYDLNAEVELHLAPGGLHCRIIMPAATV